MLRRNYRLTAKQVDLIIYCVNSQRTNMSDTEDNEARKIVDEMMKGGSEEISCVDISDPTDPYYNSCDI